MAHLQIANRLRVLWVPVSIATRWSLSWAPENGESALVELCRLLLESRDDAIMTLDTYLGLGDGLSKAYLSKQIDHAPISKAAMVALTFLSREPERAWTAESLAEAMGGRRWNERSPTHPGPIEAIISEHRQWLYGVAGSKHYGLGVSRDKVLERMAAQPDDGPPRIQFSLVGHEVQVGDSTMDPGAFLMMLRSTKPGKGFFIEYLAPLGQNDVPPPAWFREEVMGPAGFTTRVLTPAGEAALLVRGGTK